MPASASWELAASQAAASTSVSSTGVSRAGPRPRYLARGLLIPLRRDQKSDFANGTGEELARSKVLQVLATNPGEVEWRPLFGCNIHRARHKSDTAILRAMIKATIQDAFAQWLKSYVLTDISFTARDRTLFVRVVFNERTANGARFPSDLATTVPLPMAA